MKSSGGSSGASGAAQVGGGSGGRAGAGGLAGAGAGSGTGGSMFVDRCRTPGPPPAIGNPDGSDYHFGTPRDVFTIYPTYDHLALGDVDRDGYLDLLASARDDLHLFTAIAPASFAALVPLEIGISASIYQPPPLLTHVDSDPGLDVVMGHGEGMSIVWNDGSGSFSRFERTLGPAATRPVVADIDSDGDRDVVALWNAERFREDAVTLYLNDGGGRFEAEQVPLETDGYRLRVADVTGDGAPEVLVSTIDSSIRIYTRSSNESFTLMSELPRSENLPAFQLWFDTGDLDGDGRSDLVTVEDEDFPDLEQVYVSYQRDGRLEPLRAVVPIPKDGGNIAGGEVTITDINLDGRNDIVFTSSAFDMVAVLAKSDGTFREEPRAFPTAGSVLEGALAVGDLDCDGCPDALGANVGHIVLFPGVACAH